MHASVLRFFVMMLNPDTSPTPNSLPNEALQSSSTSNTAATASAPPLCQGAQLSLSGSLWGNYPWHLHDPSHSENIPFWICSINNAGDVIHIRSRSCAVVVSQSGRQSCTPCAEQRDSRELKLIFERALTEAPVNGLNLRYYSQKQLADHLESKEEALKKYRLKACIPS